MWAWQGPKAGALHKKPLIKCPPVCSSLFHRPSIPSMSVPKPHASCLMPLLLPLVLLSLPGNGSVTLSHFVFTVCHVRASEHTLRMTN